MERLRQGPVVKRVAISIVVLYALLLQAFIAAAAPVAFAPDGAIACTQGDWSSQPRGEHHGDGLCCILACAACGCAYVPAKAGAAFIQVRKRTIAHWSPALPIGANGARGSIFSARGPPQAL